MANRHVSYRSEFGIALHERGLNALSAGLRDSQPHLFAFREDIPIVRAEPNRPGHTLTLYAVADEPLAFNLYPVAGTPALTEDSFFVSVNILFTLTDDKLGSVTRMRVIAEAAGQIVRRATGLAVRLATKPDGSSWFDIISIEGEHPARFLSGASDLQVKVAGLPEGGEDDTARSFRAIMNYLIALFLKDGLMRTVTEFPLPSLGDLVEAGPLGKLPGREIFIRNDALYLTLGNEVSGDWPFPGPFPAADLAIGVNERGLQRLLDAMAPMPIPIDVGQDNTTLRVRSSNFRVRTINVDLRPGEDKFHGRIFFGGTLGIRLQFKAFGKWVRTPYVPLPIDDAFSHYAGFILPFIHVENRGEANERFELRLQPDTRFLELWYIFIVTNYRGLFRDFFRSLVDQVKDELIYKKFKKIPIIGWILDKVLDITADVLAWVLGSVFDAFMSTELTWIVNTLGRAVMQFLKRPDFTVLKIEQSAIVRATGLKISGGEVRQVSDGRGGELQLGLSFSSGHFPAPPAPLPSPPDPEPVPIPDLPGPVLPRLPEHAPGAFEPALSLEPPAWTDGTTETYSVEVSGGQIAQGRMEIRYERDGDSWRILKSIAFDSLGAEATATAVYDAQGRPRRAEYRHAEADGPGAPAFRQAVDLSAPGRAVVSSASGAQHSFERSIDVLDSSRMELDEFWLFRLAASPLASGESGYLGRVEVSDPMSYQNWVRLIPLKIAVSATTIPADEPGEPDVEAFALQAADEDGSIDAIVVPGLGLLKAELGAGESKVIIRRI